MYTYKYTHIKKHSHLYLFLYKNKQHTQSCNTRKNTCKTHMHTHQQILIVHLLATYKHTHSDFFLCLSLPTSFNMLVLVLTSTEALVELYMFWLSRYNEATSENILKHNTLVLPLALLTSVARGGKNSVNHHGMELKQQWWVLGHCFHNGKCNIAQIICSIWTSSRTNTGTT